MKYKKPPARVLTLIEKWDNDEITLAELARTLGISRTGAYMCVALTKKELKQYEKNR